MSSTSSISSSSNRLSGLVSGFDADAMVEKLMTAEKVPLNKLYQKKQLAEWKRDAYREITSSLKAFNDKYFDILKTDNCMFSQNTYKQYATSSTDSSVVTITGSSEAAAGTHTITVSSLATAGVYKSSPAVTKDICGSSSPDYSAAAGKSFVLNLDGDKTTITLDSGVTRTELLQSAIDEAVGTGKVTVSENGEGYLTLSGVEDSGIGSITLSDGSDGALTALGFSSGANLSSRLNKSDTLETLAGKMKNSFSFDSDGKLNLSINGTDFTFDKSTTLSSMISTINGSSTAGVTMKYDESSDAFVFTAKSTGAGKKIVIDETGSNFLEKAGITDYTEGKDAVVTIDGQKLVRSTNSITKDGVTYKLLSESPQQQTVSLSLDTNTIYKKIEAFISDYNALIEQIDTKISEKYDRDYPPLTDEEKAEMSEDEITLWEKKAKTGLLHNDSTLETMLDKFRSALYASVEGVSASLTGIGITTTGNYEDKGKLTINSATLKEAIENNPDEVMNLFSRKSSSYSGTTTVRTLTSSERATRTKEEGLAYRLYDILQDSISTYRDNSGKKGILLEKAGMEGDATEYSNSITEDIYDYEDAIAAMIDKLNDKEDAYYARFTAMETYINQMNSQLSSLQSYLG